MYYVSCSGVEALKDTFLPGVVDGVRVVRVFLGRLRGEEELAATFLSGLV